MLALGDVARDPQVQALARELTDQYLADPSSVDHEIASIALRIAALNGDQTLYDRIMADLKAAKTPEAYFTDISALRHFSDPKLVEKTLEFAISPAHALTGCSILGRRRDARFGHGETSVEFCSGALGKYREPGRSLCRLE